MNPDTSALGLLERAVGQMDAIIGRIRPEQGSLPTPCPDWDVRALITHVVGHTMPNFTAAASGETPDWQAPAAALDADWAEAFHSAAARLLATWRAADMQRMVAWGGGQAPLRSRADQQITELAVHGWDLATATCQRTRLDTGIARPGLVTANAPARIPRTWPRLRRRGTCPTGRPGLRQARGLVRPRSRMAAFSGGDHQPPHLLEAV